MPQLVQIERRQARIRGIHTRTASLVNASRDPIANTPDSHHHIGQSQNDPVDVNRFAHMNHDDLAMKVGALLVDDFPLLTIYSPGFFAQTQGSLVASCED